VVILAIYHRRPFSSFGVLAASQDEDYLKNVSLVLFGKGGFSSFISDPEVTGIG
jgi:hypothetical protein